ncbi:MAG: TAXI family TRAP transporter solute-binding subunit [Fimbriimonadaceae bacterium]|nr:TAXI family TRAP transporter solute-binding subunit [Fimbriimonadaceae bacterium]
MPRRRETVVLALAALLLTLAVGRLLRRQHQQVHLRLAAGVAGGAYDTFARALADVVAAELPRCRIEVVSTAGSADNIHRMESGDVELALTQSDVSLGRREQLVAVLFPETCHLVVRRASGIRRFEDLRGRRVARPPSGSGSAALFEVLLAHYGLRAADLRGAPLPTDEGLRQLRAGRVDALFWVVATGSPVMSALLQAGGCELLPLDQVAALRLKRPALELDVIPRGAYGGSPALPPADIATAALRALLLADREVPSGLVQALATMVYEQRARLVARSPQAAQIDFPAAANGLGLPVHPGAQAYFRRDQPAFIVTYAEPIGLGITILLLFWSGLAQLQSTWQRHRKDRADTYNHRVLELIDAAREAPDTAALDATRARLLDLFREVIADLDADRLSPDAFRAFALAWEVAHGEFRQRAQELAEPPSS